jgi:DNA repair protein SbcC/Rad50
MLTNIVKISGSGFMVFKSPFIFSLEELGSKTIQIDGKNLDDEGSKSNGSGKSTLLETISWGIYGKLSRRNRLRDEIIHKDSNEASVSIGFEQQNTRYTLIRKITRGKTALLTILQDLKEILKGATYEKKQEEIEKIIGMNFIAFQCSVMFGRDFMTFPDLRPAERGKVLSDIRNLDRYMASSKKSGERAKSIGIEMTNLAQKVEINLGRLDELRKTSFKKDIEGFEEERGHIIRRHEINMQAKKETLLIIQSEIAKKVSLLEQQKHQLTKQIEEINKSLEQEEKIQEIINVKNSLIAEQNAEMRQIESDLKELNESIREIEKHGEGTCPFCEKTLTGDDIEILLSSKEQKILSLQNKLEKASNKKDSLEFNLTGLKDKMVHFRNKKLVKDGKTKEVNNLDIEIINTKKNNTEIELKTQIKSLKSMIDLETNKINPYIEREENRNNSIKQLGKTIRDGKTDLADLTEEKMYYEIWVDGFKKIRMGIFEGMVDHLESLSQTYLSKYSSELNVKMATERETQSGTIKDEFTIMVIDDKGREMSYEMYSGGEKQKVRLAISRALAQFISDDCNVDFNFIAFDEPNDALDDAGKEANFDTFEELAGLGKTVLVTDHDANFKDRFETNITVIKENGESRINHA